MLNVAKALCAKRLLLSDVVCSRTSNDTLNAIAVFLGYTNSCTLKYSTQYSTVQYSNLQYFTVLYIRARANLTLNQIALLYVLKIFHLNMCCSTSVQ